MVVGGGEKVEAHGPEVFRKLVRRVEGLVGLPGVGVILGWGRRGGPPLGITRCLPRKGAFEIARHYVNGGKQGLHGVKAGPEVVPFGGFRPLYLARHHQYVPHYAPSPLTVSYYDGSNGAVAQASGRGYTRTSFENPSITAPGINIKGALPGDRFAVRSGSCAAAAITAGAVALMLEWQLYERKMPGIDVFQIKSLLILGAIRPDSMEYPNREWGYGQLNLYNTFEVMRQL